MTIGNNNNLSGLQLRLKTNFLLQKGCKIGALMVLAISLYACKQAKTETAVVALPEETITPAIVQEKLTVKSVYQHSHCQANEAKVGLIRNPQELAEWWLPFSRMALPGKPLPDVFNEIDFASQNILIVYMGSRPTAGYNITLAEDQATMVDNNLILNTLWHKPKKGASLAQMKSSPCLALVVSKSDYTSIQVADDVGEIMLQAAVNSGQEPDPAMMQKNNELNQLPPGSVN